MSFSSQAAIVTIRRVLFVLIISYYNVTDLDGNHVFTATRFFHLDGCTQPLCRCSARGDREADDMLPIACSQSSFSVSTEVLLEGGQPCRLANPVTLCSWLSYSLLDLGWKESMIKYLFWRVMDILCFLWFVEVYLYELVHFSTGSMYHVLRCVGQPQWYILQLYVFHIICFDAETNQYCTWRKKSYLPNLIKTK